MLLKAFIKTTRIVTIFYFISTVDIESDNSLKIALFVQYLTPFDPQN